MDTKNSYKISSGFKQIIFFKQLFVIIFLCQTLYSLNLCGSFCSSHNIDWMFILVILITIIIEYLTFYLLKNINVFAKHVMSWVIVLGIFVFISIPFVLHSFPIFGLFMLCFFFLFLFLLLLYMFHLSFNWTYLISSIILYILLIVVLFPESNFIILYCAMFFDFIYLLNILFTPSKKVQKK